jgi:ribosomal protein S25
MINEIGEQLREYVEKESTLRLLKETLQEKKKQFEEQNKEIIERIKEIDERTEYIKSIAKEEAIKEFQATGNKKLSYGLGIRVGVEIYYPEEQAFNWAKEHKLCLKLDTKAFENLAKTQEIEFVEKKEKITATFPKELKLEDNNEKNN